MAPEDQFPKLAQLMGAYFHQDWADDDPDEMAVVREYARFESPDGLRRVVREINDYLSLPPRAKGPARTLFEDFGCYVHTSTLGLTDAEWLRRIQEELRRLQPPE
jgi:hypothetical protein